MTWVHCFEDQTFFLVWKYKIMQGLFEEAAQLPVNSQPRIILGLQTVDTRGDWQISQEQWLTLFPEPSLKFSSWMNQKQSLKKKLGKKILTRTNLKIFLKLLIKNKRGLQIIFRPGRNCRVFGDAWDSACGSPLLWEGVRLVDWSKTPSQTSGLHRVGTTMWPSWSGHWWLNKCWKLDPGETIHSLARNIQLLVLGLKGWAWTSDSLPQ